MYRMSRNIVATLLLILTAATGESYAKPRANGFMKVACGRGHMWCFEENGYRYRNNTLYNIVRQSKAYVTIVDESGKHREVNRYANRRRIRIEYIRGQWDTAWDFENNRPTPDAEDQYFQRYYHNAIWALFNYFPFTQIAVVLILFAYFRIARLGRDLPKTVNEAIAYIEGRSYAFWTYLVVGGVLTVGAVPGGLYNDIVERYEVLYAYLDQRRLPSGYFLPLNRGVLVRYPSSYMLVSLPYVAAFTAIHLPVVPWVIWRSPSFVRGMHYLFLRHPAESAVEESKGEGEDHKKIARSLEAADAAAQSKPPMPFVSRNLKRKAARLIALTERRRKERKLLEEHEQFVREEAARKERRERNE